MGDLDMSNQHYIELPGLNSLHFLSPNPVHTMAITGVSTHACQGITTDIPASHSASKVPQ